MWAPASCFPSYQESRVFPKASFLPTDFVLYWPEVGHIVIARKTGKGRSELDTLSSPDKAGLLLSASGREQQLGGTGQSLPHFTLPVPALYRCCRWCCPCGVGASEVGLLTSACYRWGNWVKGLARGLQPVSASPGSQNSSPASLQLCAQSLWALCRGGSPEALHQQGRLPAGNLSAFSLTWEMALRQRDSQGRAFQHRTPILPRMQYPQKPGLNCGLTVERSVSIWIEVRPLASVK